MVFPSSLRLPQAFGWAFAWDMGYCAVPLDYNQMEIAALVIEYLLQM